MRKSLISMERWQGKIAIVTGASAGIGAATAKLLAQKGMKVVGLARRVELIEEMIYSMTDAPGELYALKCDMSEENQILEAFAWVKENLGPISVLINNAGFIRPTTLTEGSTDEWRSTFDVNVIGLCICTREAVRSMRDNNIAGHIVHLGSIAGRYPVMMPTPVINVYSATKYAVTALTENLRQELNFHKTGIKISMICPGVVSSEFHEGYIKDGTKEAVTSGPILFPSDIADAIVFTLSTPPHVQVHDIMIKSVGELI